MTPFADLLKALVNAEVKFILVGGFAGIVHGAARVTYDIDVLYERSSENYARLVAALAPLQPYLRGAPVGLPFRWDTRTVASGLNFTLTTTAGDLDLFGEIVGGSYTELISHTIRIRFSAMSLVVLDLPTLINVKRRTGRPKDLEAIGELELLVADGTKSQG